MSESAIFKAAIKLSPESRAAFLDQACASNGALRQEIESMLRAHDASGGFLGNLSPQSDATEDFEPITETAGTIIGPYKLMEQIGQGGMGLVFVAEQHHPIRRKVALKIIKPGMDTRDVIARFEAERQALALMDHPNIAKVLDGGATESGLPYFVMELVKGIPIIDYCDHQQLTTRERLDLFQSVCQAVQHAHGKGIIHRDLKPSNILVAPHDGVPVVKVIDFGVAKAIGQQLTDKTIYTRFAQMIGTPLYMSPEQAEINALDVDIRSDVYSLGVLLYELLTGTTPFDRQRFAKAAYDEIRRIIKEEDPPRPSTRLSTLGSTLTKVSAQRKTEPAKLSALVKGDLDWIVMKSLEKNRERRYDTASALGADVRRFLEEQPIEARPPSTWYRLGKMARRNRVALTTLCVVAAALVIGTGVSTWQAIRATRAERQAMANERSERASRSRADAERDAAAAARDKLRQALYASQVNLIQDSWESNNIGRGRELLDDPLFKADGADLHGFEWHYWKRQYESGFREIPVPENPSLLTRRGIDAGAQHIATFAARWSTFTKNSETTITVSDARSGQVVRQFHFEEDASVGSGRAYMLPPVLGGHHVAYYSIEPNFKNQVWVWDTRTGNRMTLESEEDNLEQMVFSSDGSKLAAIRPARGVRQEGALVVWDLATGRQILRIPGLTRLRGDLKFSADGTRLGATFYGTQGQKDGVVRLWDAATGMEVLKIPCGYRVGTSLAISPDGTRIATNSPSEDSSVILWDALTGKKLQTLTPYSQGVYLVCFNHDGTRLAVGGGDGLIAVWSLDRAQGEWSPPSVRLLRGHTGSLTGLAFSTDGRHMFSIPTRGKPLAWELLPQNVQAVIPAGTDDFPFKIFAIRNDGQRVLTALGKTKSSEIVMWNGSAEERWHKSIPRDPEQTNFGMTSCGFSPDGKRCAIAARGPYVLDKFFPGGLLVLDVETGEVSTKIPDSGDLLGCYAFSPDGRSIAFGRKKTTTEPEFTSEIVVAELDTGRELWSLSLPSEFVEGLAFSPDGRQLAGSIRHSMSNKSYGKGVIRIWDTSTRTLQSSLAESARFHSAMQFSPDGRRIACLSSTSESGIWDVASRKQLVKLGEYSNATLLQFSPDGRRVVTSGVSRRNENSLRICDTETGREFSTLVGTGAEMRAFTFSRDGNRLFSAANSADWTGTEIVVWDGTPLEGGKKKLDQ